MDFFFKCPTSFYNQPNDFSGKIAYISQIAVKADSQGSGIGSVLFVRCEELSRQNGMEHLRLEVKNTNAKAIRFYQKLGLQFEKKATGDSVYMIKHLIGKQ